MTEATTAPVNPPSRKVNAATACRFGPLDRARAEFAKLLGARISERERDLAALRAELASIGGNAAPRKAQACSGCGRAGHTKRTCPGREKKENG